MGSEFHALRPPWPAQGGCLHPGHRQVGGPTARRSAWSKVGPKTDLRAFMEGGGERGVGGRRTPSSDRGEPRSESLWVGINSRSRIARWSPGSPGGRGPPGATRAHPGATLAGDEIQTEQGARAGALEVLEGEGLQDRSKPSQVALWLGRVSSISAVVGALKNMKPPR